MNSTFNNQLYWDGRIIIQKLDLIQYDDDGSKEIEHQPSYAIDNDELDIADLSGCTGRCGCFRWNRNFGR